MTSQPGKQTILILTILYHFITAYHISLVNVHTNYCDSNLLILDVKKLNKIIKLYYFYTLKALWDGQGKVKMYYGISRVKKQLLGKRSIAIHILYNISRTKDNQTMRFCQLIE